MLQEYIDKIDTIIAWSKNRKKPFDITFVESVRAFAVANECITEKQMKCIDNIIDKFKI
jgi:hypothetical protein